MGKVVLVTGLCVLPLAVVGVIAESVPDDEVGGYVEAALYVLALVLVLIVLPIAFGLACIVGLFFLVRWALARSAGLSGPTPPDEA